MSLTPEWDVVIIGGGITGLSAARKIVRTQSGSALRCLLVEGGSRLGGTIETIRRDGFVIEKGPDAFLTERPWALDLARSLGLAGEMIGTNPDCRRSFVLRKRRLCPVPPGFYLIAPSEIRPFLISPILSWRGKLRLLAEPLIPARTAGSDESVASFVTRRMGREAYERIAQPMVGGIYTGDPARLSAARALPKFVAMEREKGSVLKGLIQSRNRLKEGAGAGGPRYGLFASFKKGMETLPLKLSESLSAGSIRLNTDVRSLRFDSGASLWNMDFGNGERVTARAVLVATPAHRAAHWFESSDPKLSGALRAIEYESVVTVSYAFSREVVAHALDGFGFVVPAGEARTVIAGSFSSVKFDGRAPQGKVLIRIFVGGAFGRAVLDSTDDEIAQAGEAELRELLGIRGRSLFCEISRHRQAMPQYVLGHETVVAHIKEAAGRWPGLEFAGAAYDGVGIPECVRQGEEASGRLMNYLTQNQTIQGAR